MTVRSRDTGAGQRTARLRDRRVAENAGPWCVRDPFTFPANRATENWTMLPAGWEDLRRQWEYSHAAAATLYFIALVTLMLSVLSGRR